MVCRSGLATACASSRERLRRARRHIGSCRRRAESWHGGDESTVAPLVEAGFDVGAVLHRRRRSLASCARARSDAAPERRRRAVAEHARRRARHRVRRQRSSHSRVVRMAAGHAVHRRAFGTARALPSRLPDRAAVAHVIELVRPVHGVTVTSVVACGNLPNLRSLAMLLIEEMDLEVETLDSDELLDPSRRRSDDRRTSPSLQLAPRSHRRARRRGRRRSI